MEHRRKTRYDLEHGCQLGLRHSDSWVEHPDGIGGVRPATLDEMPKDFQRLYRETFKEQLE